MARFQSWRNSNRAWLKDVIPLDTPYNLAIEPAAMCNIRCIYCSQSVSPAKGIMSMDTFYKVIEDAHAFPQKIKMLDMYYSGEPLCNPNFEKMVSYAKKENIAEKIGVTTNGLLLTKERIHAIIESGIDVIRISLQGLNSETYKRICGADIDFNQFLARLQYLYKHRASCKVRMKIADIAIDDDKHGRDKFEEIFGEIADSIFIENIIPLFSSVNYDNINVEIKENANNGRNNVVQNEVRKVCYRPFIKMAVDVDGNISANCCDHYVRNMVYGNIMNISLFECWNGEQRKNFLRMHLQGKRFNHKFCKDCTTPNDISSEEDLIDPYAEELLKKI